jgi:raffinose/stachyose/melibiose transport system substrate-binding protein
MKKCNILLVITLPFFCLLLCSCNLDKNNSKTIEESEKKIEFFHWKYQSKEAFDKLIEEFEKLNPDIDVEQVSVPNGRSVLKTRIARGDVPDVFVTYPIEQDYILRVKKGILLDLTKEEFIRNIQPDIQNRYLVNGRMYGVAFSQNAVGVIYNKEIFQELKIEIPRTWDNFIRTLESLKKSGVQPILMGNKDPEEISIFNLNLVANEFDRNYWDGLNKGKINITEDQRWFTVSNKMLQVLNYAQPNSFSVDSGQVRQAFVNGEGAMHIIGTFSLPEIEELNRNFNYGIFPFPVTNDPSKNKVLGGVDVGLVIAADTQYPEESKKFLSFLLESKNAQVFSDFEGSISAVKGVEMKKQEVRPIELLVKQGKGVNWPNHYWIGGTAAEDDFRKLSQQFFIDGNVSAYLENLDKMFSSYSKVK